MIREPILHRGIIGRGEADVFSGQLGQDVSCSETYRATYRLPTLKEYFTLPEAKENMLKKEYFIFSYDISVESLEVITDIAKTHI
ncbi:MAG: hypothetical protein ACI9S8_002488 [Chlamydiales bacterium]|jgi:hypothetical protein